MNGYVAGGWSVTAVVLASYAWRILRRGRLLSGEEERLSNDEASDAIPSDVRSERSPSWP